MFYIEDKVNKYLLTHLLPPVANGRQYVASKISASVKGALPYITKYPPNVNHVKKLHTNQFEVVNYKHSKSYIFYFQA